MKHSFHPDALEEYLGAVSYYADSSSTLAGVNSGDIILILLTTLRCLVA